MIHVSFLLLATLHCKQRKYLCSIYQQLKCSPPPLFFPSYTHPPMHTHPPQPPPPFTSLCVTFPPYILLLQHVFFHSLYNPLFHILPTPFFPPAKDSNQQLTILHGMCKVSPKKWVLQHVRKCKQHAFHAH